MATEHRAVTGAQRRRPRLLLVRQWDQQVGGSGCCGRFSGATVQALHGDETDPYAFARSDMEAAGAVYRELRSRFSEQAMEIVVVDPRNTAWLMPTVWRDARRRGLGAWHALRELHRATRPLAVVSDGLVIAQADDVESVVVAVELDRERRGLDRHG